MKGGCAGTQHGCCKDQKTAKADKEGSNCAEYQMVGGPCTTQFSCCDDKKTAKEDKEGSNCAENQVKGGCAGTQHGCCNDKKTAKEDKEGANCAENEVTAATTFGGPCMNDDVTLTTAAADAGFPFVTTCDGAPVSLCGPSDYIGGRVNFREYCRKRCDLCTASGPVSGTASTAAPVVTGASSTAAPGAGSAGAASTAAPGDAAAAACLINAVGSGYATGHTSQASSGTVCTFSDAECKTADANGCAATQAVWAGGNYAIGPCKDSCFFRGDASAVAKAAADAAAKAYTAAGCDTDAAKDGCAELKKAKAAADAKVADLADGSGASGLAASIAAVLVGAIAAVSF